jgi:hypothetical protein
MAPAATGNAAADSTVDPKDHEQDTREGQRAADGSHLSSVLHKETAPPKTPDTVPSHSENLDSEKASNAPLSEHVLTQDTAQSHVHDPVAESQDKVKEKEASEKHRVEEKSEEKEDGKENDQPEDEPAGNYLSGVKLAILTFGLCMSTFVVALDNTIIATAIPKITTVFNSLDDVGWYGSSYLLTTTSLQPSFGKIYTYFNVKWTYIFAITLFEGTYSTHDITEHYSYIDPSPWRPQHRY